MFRHIRKAAQQTSLIGIVRRQHAPTLLSQLVFSRFLADNSLISTLIADSLLPKCGSCGVLLQSEHADKPGYYVSDRAAKPYVRDANKVHDHYTQHLSEEDKMLLLNGASPSVPDAHSERSKLREAKQNIKSYSDTKIQCTRCRDALFRSQFPPDQYQIHTVAQVMESIPPDANLMYVVNPVDFPMSLDPEVFKYRLAKTMQFVVSKCDLFFPKTLTLRKNGLQFFQDYLWRTYGVPPENVFCVSGKIDWYTEELFHALKDNLFLIGNVNSGKSTLILSILHVAKQYRDKLPNARKNRQLQKLEDSVISRGKPTNRQALLKYNREAVSNFKKVYGPGSSYMPGFTRGNLPFELSKNVTVYDVPGFDTKNTQAAMDCIAPEHLKSLYKGQKMHNAGLYKSHYDTVKENRVYTVGGLLMLQVPSNAMLQVRNVINCKPHVFRDIDKAMHVWHHQDEYPELPNVFVVDANKTKLRKFVIPSFYGSVDLVIRSFGYINIKPTGGFGANPFVVYLPTCIDAVIRQPITTYLTRTLAGRDAKGNVLRKESWVEKSVTEVKRYTGKTPFFSRLIPVEKEEADVTDAMERYVRRSKGQAVAHREISIATKYANWI